MAARPGGVILREQPHVLQHPACDGEDEEDDPDHEQDDPDDRLRERDRREGQENVKDQSFGISEWPGMTGLHDNSPL